MEVDDSLARALRRDLRAVTHDLPAVQAALSEGREPTAIPPEQLTLWALRTNALLVQHLERMALEVDALAQAVQRLDERWDDY